MKNYCIVYRTGGTDNYKWHRSLSYQDRGEAILRAAELRNMGYSALVTDTMLSMALGLPEGYEYN